MTETTDRLVAVELMHAKVKLGSGVEGVVLGIWQQTKETPYQFLVEGWYADGTQKTKWFPARDFDIIQ